MHRALCLRWQSRRTRRDRSLRHRAHPRHAAQGACRARACMSRFSTVPVRSSSWSASVDLPWSMCAIIAKFRMRSGPCTAISRGLPASSGADVVAADARAAQPQRLQGRGSAGRPDVLAAPQRSWLHAGRILVSPACSHMLAPCCLTASCCLTGVGKLLPSESRPLGRAARTRSRSVVRIIRLPGAKDTAHTSKLWRQGWSTTLS